MMCQKLGITNPLSKDESLIRELLSWMQDISADYTNTFLYIWGNTDIPHSELYEDERFKAWHTIWKQRVWDLEAAQGTMKKHNPVYIPRNYLVEKVLDEATAWNYKNFHTFLEILKNPYTHRKDSDIYMEHDTEFERNYMTYCGT